MLMESKGDERGRVLRIAAPVVRTWEEDPEYLQTRERSASKLTHAASASIGCDDPGCGVFLPWRPCRAPRKKIRGPCLAPRITSHRHNSSSATRKRHATACASTRDRMPQHRITHKHENACRCAYRVQHAQLLCKSRGKTGQCANATKSIPGFSTCVNQFVTTANGHFRLCSRTWQCR
jgi:hypothetical protein